MIYVLSYVFVGLVFHVWEVISKKFKHDLNELLEENKNHLFVLRPTTIYILRIIVGILFWPISVYVVIDRLIKNV